MSLVARSKLDWIIGSVLFASHNLLRITEFLPKSAGREPLQQPNPTKTDITFRAWDSVDLEAGHNQNPHQRFWWKSHSGKILAIFLHHAGYSESLQCQYLRFFATFIASYLGPSLALNHSKAYIYKSFMTDDGTPLEISWDWGTNDQPPVIRYSMEPLGIGAGTHIDLYNQNAATTFHAHLLQHCSDTHLDWFEHFKSYFNVPIDPNIAFQEGHCSQIFYAFDLTITKFTTKAYFFPAFQAATRGLSKLEAISESIYLAPHTSSQRLLAFSVFHDFALDPHNKSLEYEMLALDLIDPSKARIKVYFRSRQTDFDSVVKIMTLGGRVRNENVDKGIKNLERLWKGLLEIETGPLPQLQHRTAGILYNIEFKLGSKFPITKIYIPVRHYCRSDQDVITKLGDFFQYSGRKNSINCYEEAMKKSFSQTRNYQSMVQTYLGCAIREDGGLRLVSYFKP